MPLRTSVSDTWPRSQPPSYHVQPPTPARGSPAHTPRRSGVGSPAHTPRHRQVWEAPGVSHSPSGSGTTTPRHAYKMSSSSSTHSLRHSSSNGSLRGMSRSGSHTSLGTSPSYLPRSRSMNQHLVYSHYPSPVTEMMEVVDPIQHRPSPPSSHLASSGSADEPETEYESDEMAEMEHGFDPPCQFYGYPASETLYAASTCECCVPVHTHTHHTPGYGLVLANEHYPHPHLHETYSTPPRSGMLTGFAHRLFYDYIAPHLPEDLQAIIADPPDLRRPDSLVPLLRVIAPYAQYLIFLLALYIVYAFVTGMVSYAARFIRFCFRIGPVIAIIAWIMAASGQGGIEVVYEALKSYAGLTPTDGGAAGRARARGARQYGHGQYHANPRTRTHRRRQEPQPDILSAIFGNPATGQEGVASNVQDYVRAAVAKGLGLEWLVGKKEEGKKSKTR
ncbi:hypothetical protein CcaverHIS002_0510600 [Cutaneotrichosporon cavernicola]|uniref:Uncharacterized protein n=1 Tax=Cutaneotrichosporon cavernicola TaxID=279322 RepID=A0AA48L7S5_9TREE|nr:uncharacterized protein CcaverHIS019_0511150 [Cutaneotrichosporon cavernicola]BEI85659.1 hypothetical protein CcaverHIS002_0510600 [Cutaneotrichosporon cavernicola]BEI93487.1 hypothetical protein CcaverHIS019_0511150 [Cutaneotrichosporon cavernicola]BEJ01266.1 hypothetical protein CcaverHIS631_0511230 [Cutaneotrichosporon cavernicola]